jgi:hypothetical protein
MSMRISLVEASLAAAVRRRAPCEHGAAGDTASLLALRSSLALARLVALVIRVRRPPLRVRARRILALALLLAGAAATGLMRLVRLGLLGLLGICHVHLLSCHASARRLEDGLQRVCRL